MKDNPSQIFREIVKEHALPLFCGVSLEETLSDLLISNQIYQYDVKWKRLTCWLNRALMVRYWLYPLRSNNPLPAFPKGQLLVTWMDGSSRFTDLVLPVLQQLTDDHSCVVLYGNQNVTQFVPNEVQCIAWDELHSFEVKDWRVEYSLSKPKWRVWIKSICRQYELPIGAAEALHFWLMISSQQVMGCIAFLKLNRPAVIVTDYDHNMKWSCLVLAARSLGISTVTLVHGDMGKDAASYSPVIADKIICWGEFGREQLITAGERDENIFVGGCPRMSCDLSATSGDSRVKLGLDLLKPVIMYLATIPTDKTHLDLFCQALESLDFALGVVRLHPVYKLSSYSAFIDQYPSVKFYESNQVSVDESIASADVVVFHSSNMGNDVLNKRCPLVLLDIEEQPSGLGRDVVTLAGCPHVRTLQELVDVLRDILLDDSFRRELVLAAEPYVGSISSAYGVESARLTANIIGQVAK